MNIQDLGPAYGATKTRTRVGRGIGSGLGKTSGKGHKGQKARTGGSIRRGFEGGQTPLYRRIPKRGFNNIFAKKIVAVNVGSLNVFEDGENIDAQALINAGIIKKEHDGIKILSNGKLIKKLNVKASAFSESAKQKIEEIGGKAEVI